MLLKCAIRVEKQHLASTERSAYQDRFNQGGMGLSEEFTKGKKVKKTVKIKVDEKAAASKGVGGPGDDAIGEDDSPNGFEVMADELLDEFMVFTPGEILGDRLPPVDVIGRLMPFCHVTKKQFCLDFLTCSGCHVGDLNCPFAHSDEPMDWLPPELLRVALAKGGLRSWALTPRLCQPWMPHRHVRALMSSHELQSAVKSQLDKTLEKLTAANMVSITRLKYSDLMLPCTPR